MFVSLHYDPRNVLDSGNGYVLLKPKYYSAYAQVCHAVSVQGDDFEKGKTLKANTLIESISKDLLSKALAGQLTPADLKVWRESGHLILHWLRLQFQVLDSR